MFRFRVYHSYKDTTCLAMTRYLFCFACLCLFLVFVTRKEKGNSSPCCCFWVLFVVPLLLLLLSTPCHVNVAFGLPCRVVAFGPPHCVVVFGHYLLCYSCCLHEVELFAQGGTIVGARWTYWLTFQSKSTFFSNLINIFFPPFSVYVVFLF